MPKEKAGLALVGGDALDDDCPNLKSENMPGAVVVVEGVEEVTGS